MLRRLAGVCILIGFVAASARAAERSASVEPATPSLSKTPAVPMTQVSVTFDGDDSPRPTDVLSVQLLRQTSTIDSSTDAVSSIIRLLPDRSTRRIDNVLTWTARVPAGEYDIRVLLPDGESVEGAFVSPLISESPDTRFIRPAPPDVRTSIEAQIAGLTTIDDSKRLWSLTMGETDASVFALVESVRTVNGDGADDAGRIDWRVERWEYQRSQGVWLRSGVQIIARREFSPVAWRSAVRLFSPELGGIRIDGRPSATFRFNLPDIVQRAARRQGNASVEWRPRAAPSSIGGGKVILIETETGMVVVDFGLSAGVRQGSTISISASDGRTITAPARSVLEQQTTIYLDDVSGVSLDNPAQIE